MRTVQQGIALLLCATLANSAFAAKPEKQTSYVVIYSGGSFKTVKTRELLKLFLDADRIRLIRNSRKKDDPLIITASTVTDLSYGQEVHRRIGTAVGVGLISLGIGVLIAFSKSKKHYIGLVWDEGNGKKGGMVIQASKDEYRGLIAALEGLTGKKAVNTDTGRPNS